MKIQVTQEDIEAGVRGSFSQCPVAKALNRAGFERAVVDDLEVLFGPGIYFIWPDENEVGPFVRNFDDSAPVAPFAFEIPDEFARYAAPRA